MLPKCGRMLHVPATKQFKLYKTNSKICGIEIMMVNNSYEKKKIENAIKIVA